MNLTAGSTAMLLIVSLATLLLCAAAVEDGAAPSSSSLETITFRQFLALGGRRSSFLQSGETIPGMDDVATWVVRISYPWSRAPANSAFHQLAKRAPNHVIRVVEFVVDNVDAMTLVDMMGVDAVPAALVLTPSGDRPTVPKGHHFADRAIHRRVVLKPGVLDSVDQLYAAVLQEMPTNFIDPLTYALAPSAPVVFSVADLQLALRNASALSIAPHTRQLVAVFSSMVHRAAPVQLAHILSAAAAVGRRGAGVVVVDASKKPADFIEDIIPSEDGTVTVFSVAFPAVAGAAWKWDAKKLHIKKNIANPSVLREIIVAGDATLGTHVITPSDYEARIAAEVADAQRSVALYFKPALTPEQQRTATNEDKAVSPLRKISTLAQFQRDVMELRLGVAVIFFLRESDPGFATKIKVAREVARRAVHDTRVIIQEKPADLRIEVFFIDPEIHTKIGKAMQLKSLPAVACLLELGGPKAGTKGVKLYAGDLENPKADAIDKFIRSGEIFDGRGMIELKESELMFGALPTGPSSTPEELRTAQLTINLRRVTPPDAPATSTVVNNVVKHLIDSSVGGDEAKPASKKPSTAKEQKKAAKEAEKMEKLKAEMEAKKREKGERIRKKAEEAKAAQEAAKIENKAKAEERRKAQQAEEAANGGKKKKPAAKKKPATPAADVGKAKKVKKAMKDPRVLTKEWAADTKEVVKRYLKKSTDNDGKTTVSILDKVL